MAKQYKDPAKVMLTNVRISYANIWQPRSVNGSEPRYSLSAIIPKDNVELLGAVQRAVGAAAEAGKIRRWNGIIPDHLIMPLHDGDEERPDDESYAGAMFLKARSSEPPQIVDRHVQKIDDPMDVYSGCYCNVTVTFFPYSSEDGNGIGVGLGNIQKVRDGEHLTGKASAENDFDALEEGTEADSQDNPFEKPDFI